MNDELCEQFRKTFNDLSLPKRADYMGQLLRVIHMEELLREYSSEDVETLYRAGDEEEYPALVRENVEKWVSSRIEGMIAVFSQTDVLLRLATDWVKQCDALERSSEDYNDLLHMV